MIFEGVLLAWEIEEEISRDVCDWLLEMESMNARQSFSLVNILSPCWGMGEVDLKQLGNTNRSYLPRRSAG